MAENLRGDFSNQTVGHIARSSLLSFYGSICKLQLNWKWLHTFHEETTLAYFMYITAHRSLWCTPIHYISL